MEWAFEDCDAVFLNDHKGISVLALAKEIAGMLSP